jgi:molybdate transport system substrate-binding protein
MSRAGARISAATASIAALLSLAVVASSLARESPGSRSTLHVLAAASLAEAFNELAQRLEVLRPGLDVRISFAGSQQLVAQLEQGAVADVFASADERWMSYAQAQGLVAGEPLTFAHNRLVVIVPKPNPARIGKLQDLARGGVKLVIAAEAVPVGRYSRVVLRNLSRTAGFPADFAPRALRNVVSEEENVKSVVSKVQLGEADAGLVYRSDITPAVARYVRVFEIPESANVVASYPIATLKDGPTPDAAKAFVDLVLSADGQRVLQQHGLMPVAANTP